MNLRVTDHQLARRFEAAMSPHLDAAYNLARWLARDPHDAEDVVQEAYLRAFRFFEGFRGGDGRAWLLQIVRNTFYSWLEQHKRRDGQVEYNEDTIGLQMSEASGDEALHGTDPEKLLLRAADQNLVERGLQQLAPEYREILVLRELEELSYKEIAEIVGVPLGTVMSRLSRARAQLRIKIEAFEQR